MFNFFNWLKNAEDQDFDNRILKKCDMVFLKEHPKPQLKDFEREENIGKGRIIVNHLIDNF